MEYGSLIQRLEEQDAEAEQMEDRLTQLAREVDSSRLNAGEYGPLPESRNKAYRVPYGTELVLDRSAAGLF